MDCKTHRGARKAARFSPLEVAALHPAPIRNFERDEEDLAATAEVAALHPARIRNFERDEEDLAACIL